MSLREIGDFFGGLNYAAVAQRLRRLTSADKEEATRLLSNCQKIDATPDYSLVHAGGRLRSSNGTDFALPYSR